MSFNSNSSFVCVMCSFFIYVNGTPLTDVSIQAKSIEAADLLSANQISEILHEVMTLEDLRSGEKITQESFCNSVRRVLTTFQVTNSPVTIRAQDFIGNLNQDTRQTIIKNIITTLQSCLKQEIAEKDFPFVQKELRDVIFENNKGDLSKEFSDLSMKFVHPENQSEKNHLGSKHELVSREVGETYTDIPMLNRELGIEPKTNDKTKFEDQDGVYFHSKSGASSKRSETLSGLVKGLFLFNDRIPKPVIDNDLNRKLFLFNRNDGMDSTKTNDRIRNGPVSLFLFDDDIAKLSLSRKMGVNAPSFDYES